MAPSSSTAKSSESLSEESSSYSESWSSPGSLDVGAPSPPSSLPFSPVDSSLIHVQRKSTSLILSGFFFFLPYYFCWFQGCSPTIPGVVQLYTCWMFEMGNCVEVLDFHGEESLRVKKNLTQLFQRFRSLYGLWQKTENEISPCESIFFLLPSVKKKTYYSAFHKHVNSKVQKPPSQLCFSLSLFIITITSNEPWNTETHKTDPNPPITNHKYGFLNPLK